MFFSNRKHAGQLLAKKMMVYKESLPIILALPRGGVPVAAEIASALDAPLDVLIVRKVGAPFQPEYAVGAICEGEDPYLNDPALARSGLEPDDLGPTIKSETLKIRKQIAMFREGHDLPLLAQKVVIVVDDGLATGATLFAAVKYLKKKHVAKIVVAIPVGASSSVQKLRGKVDEVVVLKEREDLQSIGKWYVDFEQVSDSEVQALLKAGSGGHRFCAVQSIY